MKLVITQFVITSRLKVFLRLCVVACATNLAVAENPEPVDPKMVTHGCLFSGTFTQEVTEEATEEGLSESDTSNGSLFYNCKLGLIWRTEQPLVNTKILTSENLHYQLDEQDNIESLNSIPDSLQAKLLLSVLGGDNDFIEKHFIVEDDSLFNITLTPKTNNYKRGLQSIILNNNVDTTGHVEIKIRDRQGQSTIMKITQNKVYDNEQQTYSICQNLYLGTEYCNILKNPIHYQLIDG